MGKGEQHLSLFKKVYIKTHRLSKMKDILVIIFLSLSLQNKNVLQETKYLQFFYPSRTQDIVICHILHEES